MYSSSNSPSFDMLHKIVLVGDSGVGKSSLLAKYASNTFPLEHVTTIGVEFAARLLSDEVEGKKVKTQVWDTSGQERYRTITTAYYRGALAVILVFDLTKNKSLENLDTWLREARDHAVKDAKIILVGNKKDLVDKREVSQEAINDFVRDHKVDRYIPMSAKENTQANIETIFRAAVEQVLQAQAPYEVARSVMPVARKEKEKEKATGQEEKLLLANSNSTQPSDSPLNYNPTLKEILVLRLQKHIDRINDYLNADDNPGYAHGFWFCKTARADNRMVNLELAKGLLRDLKASDGSIDSVDQIFQNIKGARMKAVDRVFIDGLGATYIDEKEEAEIRAKAKACKKSGINSTELNEVIEVARYSLGR